MRVCCDGADFDSVLYVVVRIKVEDCLGDGGRIQSVGRVEKTVSTLIVVGYVNVSRREAAETQLWYW